MLPPTKNGTVGSEVSGIIDQVLVDHRAGHGHAPKVLLADEPTGNQESARSRARPSRTHRLSAADGC